MKTIMNRPTGTRFSNRIIRYGLAQQLWRILFVDLDNGVSCAGTPIHLVRAVSLTTGESGFWWIGDQDLPRYLRRRN